MQVKIINKDIEKALRKASEETFVPMQRIVEEALKAYLKKRK